MKNKTTRFLITSLIGVALVCVCVFSFLAVRISDQSSRTINEVGTLYMSSMSEQISMHFETTINLCLDQMTALVKTVVPEEIHEDPAQMEELIFNAQARDIGYLGFYHEDGSFEMVYGDGLEVADPGPFRQSLISGHRKVAIGSDAKGDAVILLGVPSLHNPTEDHPCIGLVGALPASYISDTLALSENDEHIYSFVIREDGSFILRSADADQENYFERVRTLYDDVNGMSVEQYLVELQDAMSKNENYSAAFSIRGERRHLLCTRLAHSEWYLLTFMPYGTLDNIVNNLGREWVRLSLIGGVVVLVALLLVFAKYFQLIRKQLKAVEEARQAAEEAQRAAEEAQRKAEHAQWEAEHANRAKSEFLSNMSHDIRTPMNAIVGMTAIAAANIDDKDQVQNCLKKITLSSKHLLGLINDVLDMSKIESGKMTLNPDQVSLREVMDGIVSICQPQVRAKGQQFDVFVHDISTENVLCDSVRLNQVLLNILGNAVKFTPEGGVIEVGLYEEPSPRGDGYIRSHLHVKDNGIGMSKDFLSRIFEPFTREDNARVAKEAGAGMGLPITKYIVDAMGGTITVESEQGKGSHFHIAVDMEKSAVQEKEMRLPERNVLVIDDDKTAARLAVAALDSIGLHGERAADLTQAAEMLEEQKNGPYHILLLDWDIQGQDGLRAAGELSERFGLPAALLTDGEWDELEAKSQESSVSSFISKPLFRSGLYYGLRPLIESETPVQEPERENDLDLAGRRILMAEDNELNGEIASEMLQEFGLEVDWVVNGQLCAEKFEASDPGWYDAILMDLRMPIMTGYEAATAIRASNREDARTIPIIAVSADAFKDDIQKCLDCGMNAHTAKPFNVQKVLSLLNEYLH